MPNENNEIRVGPVRPASAILDTEQVCRRAGIVRSLPGAEYKGRNHSSDHTRTCAQPHACVGRIAQAPVAVFGIGGVGGQAAAGPQQVRFVCLTSDIAALPTWNCQLVALPRLVTAIADAMASRIA